MRSRRWEGTADDLVDGAVPVVCSPVSGGTFALGETEVLCDASDSRDNTTSGSFLVRVLDTTPPALTVPADQTVEATGPNGAIATFAATATDIVDGDVFTSCDADSGSTFLLATTTVTCTTSDTRGNTAIGSFTITVEDTTAPVLVVPANFTVEATGPNGGPVDYQASATDAVDGDVTPICSPLPGTFALGTTIVSCTASDTRHNSASASFTVTVQDTTAPALTLPNDIVAEATSAAGASVDYGATATDLVDGPLGADCTPSSGTTFPLGTTTVQCTAIDQAGNGASGSFIVEVVDTTARDQRHAGGPRVRGDRA